MKKIDKNLYYKNFSQVSVNDMVMSNTSKCDNCKDKLQEFTIFVGMGQRMSTLYLSCCGGCLPIVVKKAIKIGQNNAEKQIKLAEERLYRKSLALVRKTKLNKIK